ncbi:tryptophan synthase subunit beta like protein [Parahaliea aestuarii]|uniref:Tryptophan synthase subunit beta like protein n=1 Tax=Parahaliea aestuarii TaxID=1852021 RepID=A0A5C8ZQL2_9GAMM|nr:tryptophan synthase subunit beta like protein [Parahaliea aestuarii]TXS89940.1 tryptophan synthase subunit beta like protein [Parahaliea aestuarii]
MPYVLRTRAGQISALSNDLLEGYEWIASDDAELRVFIAKSAGMIDHLSASDLDMVRVLEDLVELLVQKGVILFTELPESAQEKVLRRQSLRSDLRNDLDLLGDD